MKTYKVHTTKEVIEVKADRWGFSKSGRLVYFYAGKQLVATFNAGHMIAILE